MYACFIDLQAGDISGISRILIAKKPFTERRQELLDFIAAEKVFRKTVTNNLRLNLLGYVSVNETICVCAD